MKLIRKTKNNIIHIGGKENKLSIFLNDKTARLTIFNKDFHFGNWNKNKNFLNYAIKILSKPINTKFEIDGKQVNRIKYLFICDRLKFVQRYES